MAPSIRSSANGSTGGATNSTVSCNKPTGTASGDLLLAFCSHSATSSAMTGFTAGPSLAASTFKCDVHYRWATGSEGASYSATLTGSASHAHLIIVAISGLLGSGNPINVSGTGSAAGSDPVAPSVTSTRPDGLLFTAFTSNLSTSGSTPSGMTLRDFSNTVFTTLVFDQSWPTASATGTRTSDIAGSTAGTTSGMSLVVADANVAPNAPTLLSPTGGTTIDRTAAQVLTWTHSDPNGAGDTQTAYDLRYRVVGAGSWTDSGKIASTTSSRTISANTFSANNFEWQVRTYDLADTVGSYSSSGTFTAASPPSTPTVTEPDNLDTITGPTSLTEWTSSGQASYQVRTVADSGGSPNTAVVYYDSGEQVSSGARSHTTTYDTTGRTEHTQVRIKSSGGLWSAFASNKVTVSYAAPTAPTFTLSTVANPGAITIDTTAPGGGATVAYHEVWRRRTGTTDTELAGLVLPSASLVDYGVASGVAYQYLVTSVSTIGTKTSSAWAA